MPTLLDQNNYGEARIINPINIFAKTRTKSGEFRVSVRSGDGYESTDCKSISFLILDRFYRYFAEGDGVTFTSERYKDKDAPFSVWKKVGDQPSEKIGTFTFAKDREHLKKVLRLRQALYILCLTSDGDLMQLELSGYGYNSFIKVAQPTAGNFQDFPLAKLTYVGGETTPNPRANSETLFLFTGDLLPINTDDGEDWKQIFETANDDGTISDLQAYINEVVAIPPKQQAQQNEGKTEQSNSFDSDESAPKGFK